MDKSLFNQLKFNPFALEEYELMWKVYPDLAKRAPFCSIPEGVENFELPDLNKLIKFTVVYVDPLSPLYDEKDFDVRINKSMEVLGFDKEEERFFDFVRSNSTLWNVVLFTYFKMINAHMYESWYTLKVNLHILSAKLRSAELADSDRRQYTKMITDARDELLEVEHKLFPDEYTMKIVAQKASEGKVTGYAEKYALKLE